MDLILILGAVVALLLFMQSEGATAVSDSSASDTAPIGPQADPGVNDSIASYAPSEDVIDKIAGKIAAVEGFFQQGSLAQRTYNPGNIGNTGKATNTYVDNGAGWDALNNWITTHAQSHPEWDFYDMIHYYVTGSTTGQGAPGFINPDDYADLVASAAGADPTQSVYSAIYGG